MEGTLYSVPLHAILSTISHKTKTDLFSHAARKRRCNLNIVVATTAQTATWRSHSTGDSFSMNNLHRNLVTQHHDIFYPTTGQHACIVTIAGHMPEGVLSYTEEGNRSGEAFFIEYYMCIGTDTGIEYNHVKNYQQGGLFAIDILNFYIRKAVNVNLFRGLKSLNLGAKCQCFNTKWISAPKIYLL